MRLVPRCVGTSIPLCNVDQKKTKHSLLSHGLVGLVLRLKFDVTVAAPTTQNDEAHGGSDSKREH